MSAVRFDLNLFRVFDAIYRGGSLTRAAETLHLTQPAVSHALARLRARFDDPLFRREGRGVVPTPHAHALAPDVQQALALLDAGIRGAAEFRPERARRRFVVGMRDATELTLLAPWATALHAQAPFATLESVRFSRGRVSRDLARGELDLVLDIPVPFDAGILSQPLSDDALCVVMRRQHPLARGPLRRAAWLAAAHVVVSARPAGLSLEDAELQRRGLHRTIALRCQNYVSACAAVAASDLLLALPANLATPLSVMHDLHVTEAPIPLPRLQLQLYWHHAANDDAGNRWLRASLVDLVAGRAESVIAQYRGSEAT